MKILFSAFGLFVFFSLVGFIIEAPTVINQIFATIFTMILIAVIIWGVIFLGRLESKDNEYNY